jgi:NADPH-ferrihemoprotein reductase
MRLLFIRDNLLFMRGNLFIRGCLFPLEVAYFLLQVAHFLLEVYVFPDSGKEIGEMILYFGCRHPEHDYIYEDELLRYAEEGVLNELHVAFSRQKAMKVYVQDLLWQNRDHIWKAIDVNGAHIYVCG